MGSINIYANKIGNADLLLAVVEGGIAEGGIGVLRALPYFGA